MSDVILMDVGNTSIHIGHAINNKIINDFKIRSEEKIINKKLLVMINEKFNIDLINTKGNLVISSVVPAITDSLINLSIKHLDKNPFVVNSKVKKTIEIKTDNPDEVGSDIICASVMSKNTNDILIIDLGTAIKYIYTNYDVLSGVIIAPGIAMSIKSLNNNTALLPKIDISIPENILGRNTIECIQSGLTYGIASQLEGMISRLENKLKKRLKVILTGGDSKLISKILSHKHTLDQKLVLKGLLEIYNMNEEK
jgi:type III pantothenate kinase